MERSKLDLEDGHQDLSYKGSNAEPTSELPNNTGVPIDRGWAWMTVLGCFGMHVTIVGGIKSLGVLLVEVEERFQGVPARDLSLVIGFSMTLMMGLGLVTNLLAARYTCRAVVFVGGLLTFAGFVMTAFINRFWLIYLTCSLTCGLGFALSYAPCIVFVGSHFRDRRSLANGLSQSGSGVGSFILPNLMRWLLNRYGLPGCCMIVGALMLNVCACALLLRPHSSYRRFTGPVKKETDDVFLKVIQKSDTAPDKMETDQEHLELIQRKCVSEEKFSPSHDCNCGSLEDVKISQQGLQESGQSDSCLEVEAVYKVSDQNNLPNRHLNKEGDYVEKELLSAHFDNAVQSADEDSKEEINDMQRQDSVTIQSSDPKKSMFDRSLLSNPVLLTFIAFGFFANFGYPNVFFMLPAHAENEGENRDDSALLLSIIGITDLSGRLFVGWFADLKLFERRYMFIGFTVASGVLYIFLPLVTTFWGIATFAILYGFCCGSYITLIPVTLADTLGKDNLSSSYGLTAMAMASSLIPGSYLCGLIRDSTGSWAYAFVCAGCLVVIGGLSPLLHPLMHKYHHRRQSKQ